MSHSIDLSVIVPIYNESQNIPTLYERLSNVCNDLGLSWELVFVNDGSRDQSLLLIKQLALIHQHIKFISFSRNFGHQIAVTAGLDKCIGKAIVIIDADLQDPPELIKDLYIKYQQGYEVVYATRKKRVGESVLKLWTAKAFYKIMKSLTNINIPMNTGDFRIIDRKIVDILKAMPEPNKFLRGQISWIGFRQTSVEYDRSERLSGVTGYTYRKMIKFALDGITSFSESPLKIATVFGFVVSFCTFIMLLYALYSKFISQDSVPGWTSIIISVLFLGGIQLLSLGIIGEYISRIIANVRNRPLYIIDECNI
jgi:dolichol-phosphate mannosyltransferase